MLNMLLVTSKVKFTINANRLIHFLSCVPLVKRLVNPERHLIYACYDVKAVYGALGTIFSVFARVLLRLLYVALMVFFGGMIASAVQAGGYLKAFELLDLSTFFEQLDGPAAFKYMLNAWFFFSFFCGALINPAAIACTLHDAVMLKFLRVDPAQYTRLRIYKARVVDALLYFPVLALAAVFTGGPVYQAVFAIIILTSFRLAGELLNIALYEKWKRSAKQWYVVLPVCLIGLTLVFAAPFYIDMPVLLPAYLLTPPAIIISAAAGTLSAVYIHRSRGLGSMALNMAMELQEMLNAIDKKATTFGDSAKWNKDVSGGEADTGLFEARHGIDYLNALFFYRHRKFFLKKLRFRLGIIAAIGLTIAAMPFVDIFLNGGYRPEKNLLNNSMPAFLFIMYMVSMGGTVTKALFANCDVNMLHYQYFRERKIILESFRRRFKVILLYNLPIALLLAAVTATAYSTISWGADFKFLGLFLVSILSMCVLFSFHNVFIYYILQPYDNDFAIKSVSYRIVETVVWILAYSSFQMELSAPGYTLFIACFTAAYVLIGSVLLYLMAHKTYKLR